jgi:hypothetical protein
LDYAAIDRFLNQEVYTQDSYLKAKERIDEELKYYYKNY